MHFEIRFFIYQLLIIDVCQRHDILLYIDCLNEVIM